jgi:hypothetical protein
LQQYGQGKGRAHRIAIGMMVARYHDQSAGINKFTNIFIFEIFQNKMEFNTK